MSNDYSEESIYYDEFVCSSCLAENDEGEAFIDDWGDYEIRCQACDFVYYSGTVDEILYEYDYDDEEEEE